MQQPNPNNPHLLHIASQAKQMARGSGQEKVALMFQSVAMVSMAIMAAGAAAQLLREWHRSKPTRER